MDFKKILETIAQAGFDKETVEIYYPTTERKKEGWREIEPYSLSTDIGEEGEHLIYGEDRISPGHILNGYTVGKRKSKNNHCHSFIIGKIKAARLTGRKFKPRKNWKVEF